MPIERPINYETGISYRKLLAEYLNKHAKSYYKSKAEHAKIKLLKQHSQEFWQFRAQDIGPRDLKKLQRKFIEKGWCAGYINQLVCHFKKAYRWGVSEHLVPPWAYHAVSVVPLLNKNGRSKARPYKTIQPVTLEEILALEHFLSKPQMDLLSVHWLTGMRVKEACQLAWKFIDESPHKEGGIWAYTPEVHKNDWRGDKHTKVVFLGPKSQLVLSQYRHVPAAKPVFGVSYLTYVAAIKEACFAAGIKPWQPRQIRHSVATSIDRQFGRETAAIMLGDTITTTDVYVARNLKTAADVARKVG